MFWPELDEILIPPNVYYDEHVIAFYRGAALITRVPGAFAGAEMPKESPPLSERVLFVTPFKGYSKNRLRILEIKYTFIGYKSGNIPYIIGRIRFCRLSG